MILSEVIAALFAFTVKSIAVTLDSTVSKRLSKSTKAAAVTSLWVSTVEVNVAKSEALAISSSTTVTSVITPSTSVTFTPTLWPVDIVSFASKLSLTTASNAEIPPVAWLWTAATAASTYCLTVWGVLIVDVDHAPFNVALYFAASSVLGCWPAS